MSTPTPTEKLDQAKIKDRDMLLACALHFIHTRKLNKAFLEYLDKMKKEKS